MLYDNNLKFLLYIHIYIKNSLIYKLKILFTHIVYIYYMYIYNYHKYIYMLMSIINFKTRGCAY